MYVKHIETLQFDCKSHLFSFFYTSTNNEYICLAHGQCVHTARTVVAQMTRREPLEVRRGTYVRSFKSSCRPEDPANHCNGLDRIEWVVDDCSVPFPRHQHILNICIRSTYLIQGFLFFFYFCNPSCRFAYASSVLFLHMSYTCHACAYLDHMHIARVSVLLLSSLVLLS